MKTRPVQFNREFALNALPIAFRGSATVPVAPVGVPPADLPAPAHPRSRRAFTMIEIAIALGVIGFALVAIIGILPAGLTVQREAHQDNIIGQDGPFFLEAIRRGGPAVGLGASTSFDFLTNYVDYIAITNSGSTTALIYTNDPKSANYLSNGAMILGLLTTPEFYGNSTNFVTARIRGLTGAATEQSGSNALTSFRYFMNVEIAPFNSISPDSVNYEGYNPTNDPFDYGIRFERASEASNLVNNLYEVRLKFSWPVRPNNTAGPNRQAYRSLVSSHLAFLTNGSSLYWFFQPNNYANILPGP
jgi:type II secretory pathway pseudopilin PulG